jgi:hypothetical protein
MVFEAASGQTWECGGCGAIASDVDIDRATAADEQPGERAS